MNSWFCFSTQACRNHYCFCNYSLSVRSTPPFSSCPCMSEKTTEEGIIMLGLSRTWRVYMALDSVCLSIWINCGLSRNPWITMTFLKREHRAAPTDCVNLMVKVWMREEEEKQVVLRKNRDWHSPVRLVSHAYCLSLPHVATFYCVYCILSHLEWDFCVKHLSTRHSTKTKKNPSAVLIFQQHVGRSG